MRSLWRRIGRRASRERIAGLSSWKQPSVSRPVDQLQGGRILRGDRRRAAQAGGSRRDSGPPRISLRQRLPSSRSSPARARHRDQVVLGDHHPLWRPAPAEATPEADSIDHDAARMHRDVPRPPDEAPDERQNVLSPVVSLFRSSGPPSDRYGGGRGKPEKIRPPPRRRSSGGERPAQRMSINAGRAPQAFSPSAARARLEGVVRGHHRHRSCPKLSYTHSMTSSRRCQGRSMIYVPARLTFPGAGNARRADRARAGPPVSHREDAGRGSLRPSPAPRRECPGLRQWPRISATTSMKPEKLRV